MGLDQKRKGFGERWQHGVQDRRLGQKGGDRLFGQEACGKQD